MFVTMETDRAAASAKRIARSATNAGRTEHLKKQIPGAVDAWNALVSSIKSDVSCFNEHKKRAGQTPVRVAQRGFQCEVYLPGMRGKRLVLTLENVELDVSIHPDFPKQQMTITIELDKESQHGFWVLGEPAKEEPTKNDGHLSVQQLSEYLLKPILVSADINAEAAEVLQPG
jgi:hypothetical protein